MASSGMLLLDTQLLLWTAFQPERLSARTAKLLRNRGNAFAFSVASLWEVAIKSSLGRDDFQVDPRLLRNGLLAEGYNEVGITPEHVLGVAALPWLHRDPFDRLLVAQAQVEKITLLTADRTLTRYGKAVRAG